MKFKKIFGMMASFACTNLLLMPLKTNVAFSINAEAATAYHSCDVNRDGTIDIMDVISFNKCLLGKEYMSDFNRLDADRNGIINRADGQCIMAKIVNNSYTSITDGLSSSTSGTVSGSYFTNPDTSEEYVKYNYVTKETETYTLTINPATATSTRGLIGIDNRQYLTDQPEFDGIVNIQLGIQNSPDSSAKSIACSTGFIVGDHQIATAAHCVYSEYEMVSKKYYFLTDPNNRNDKIYLYDKDGNQTGETLTPVETHIPKTYLEHCGEEKNGENGTDYALITVKEDLSSYTHFSLGLVKNPYDNSFSTANIYVSGVPGVVNGKDNTNKKIAKGMGHIYSGDTPYADSVLYYTTDETKGNSGSPVYTVTRCSIDGSEYVSEYTAIGIVKGGNYTRNIGARMTPMLQHFYLSNPNANY